MSRIKIFSEKKINSIYENFQQCISESRMTMKAISLSIGRAHNWARQVISRKASIKADDLVMLEEKLGFNSQYILKGIEPMFLKETGSAKP